MSTLLHDLRYALRALRRDSSGLLVAVCVLALAIGANTALFSVVEAVVLRSLPFDEPARVVDIGMTLRERLGDGRPGGTPSRFVVETIRERSTSFERVTGFGGASPVLTGRGDPVRLEAQVVEPGFFAVIGARPLLGRTFVAEEGPGGRRAVVLSHALWTSRFGRDAGVVGRPVMLDGEPYDVVGVMPPGMDYPRGADLWQTRARPTAQGPARPDVQGGVRTSARLRPGVTRAQAQAELSRLFAAVAREHQGFEKWAPVLTPALDVVIGSVRRPLLLMLGAVGLVLLVACANVGSLLLARGVGRRQELAVRAALGASRARVVRLLLTESLVVAAVGAAAGALLAWWGLPLLLSLAGDALPRAAGVTLNARVLAAVAAMALATGILAGMAPVLFALRTHASTLKDGSAGAGTSGWRVRFGDGLVVAQVAITMVLLAGSALLASSFARLVRVDAGFDAGGVVVAQLQLTGTRHKTAEQQGAFGAAVLERVRALPGVEAAAVSTAVPLDGGNVGSITVEGRPAREDAPWAWFTGVTPEYFQLLGVPLLRGRTFGGADAAGGDAVVVNHALVREFFGGADPIGRTVTYYGNVTGRIVGVVGDTRQQGLDEAAPPQIYIPFPRETSPYLKIGVRARDGASVAAAVREAVRSVDPMLPLDRVTSLSAMVSDSVARERFYAVLLALFAGTALAIAAMGLYALTAYTFTRRHRELGIRLALGAGGRRLVWSLVGRVGALGAAGIGLGLAGALASARVLRAHLFELSPTDPATLALAAATLAGTALLASWLPARRAARVDPVAALRAE